MRIQWSVCICVSDARVRKNCSMTWIKFLLAKYYSKKEKTQREVDTILFFGSEAIHTYTKHSDGNVKRNWKSNGYFISSVLSRTFTFIIIMNAQLIYL